MMTKLAAPTVLEITDRKNEEVAERRAAGVAELKSAVASAEPTADSATRCLSASSGETLR